MSTGSAAPTVTLAKTTLALALSALAAGCGGARPAPDLHAAFSLIQVHEATIARSSQEAEACEHASCPAYARVCEAASAICDIAAEVDDADALARCELARRRCPREAAR